MKHKYRQSLQLQLGAKVPDGRVKIKDQRSLLTTAAAPPTAAATAAAPRGSDGRTRTTAIWLLRLVQLAIFSLTITSPVPWARATTDR